MALFTTLFFGPKKGNSALCTAVANGNWNNAATWSCGHVPTCGDSIVIPTIRTVTVNAQNDYTGCAIGTGPKIVIYGTLKFVTGNKIKLPCDSRIYVMPGGSVQPGGGGGNSNEIEICNDVLWKAGDGTLTGPTCLPPTAVWCLGVVLPVELVDFTAEAKDGYVGLSWITATETNCDHFELERSLDAQTFYKFNSQDSKGINGNSQSILKYNATDEDPITNVSYYRLKQVDKSSATKYSNIISVNYIKWKNIKFVVYPNPNKGEFTADITGIENNHAVAIALIDEKGAEVYNSEFYIMDAASSKLQIIPQNRLLPGIYNCILTMEDIQYKVKVVVN